MIVLRVGDRMFISSGEKLMDETGANLPRSRVKFENRIKKMLPGVDVRYYNWGW